MSSHIKTLPKSKTLSLVRFIWFTIIKATLPSHQWALLAMQWPFWILIFEIAIIRCLEANMHTKLPLEHHMIAIENNRIQNGYCIICQKVLSFSGLRKCLRLWFQSYHLVKYQTSLPFKALVHAFSVTASLFMVVRVVLNNCVCIFCYFTNWKHLLLEEGGSNLAVFYHSAWREAQPFFDALTHLLHSSVAHSDSIHLIISAQVPFALSVQISYVPLQWVIHRSHWS